MSQYKFSNGNTISLEEIYECDCEYNDWDKYLHGYGCDHRKLIDMKVDFDSDYTSTEDMNNENIDELQKFLMKFWYLLEKIKD